MVYGMVELLLDDPVSIAVSIYWSLYIEDDFEWGSL